MLRKYFNVHGILGTDVIFIEENDYHAVVYRQSKTNEGLDFYTGSDEYKWSSQIEKAERYEDYREAFDTALYLSAMVGIYTEV